MAEAQAEMDLLVKEQSAYGNYQDGAGYSDSKHEDSLHFIAGLGLNEGGVQPAARDYKRLPSVPSGGASAVGKEVGQSGKKEKFDAGYAQAISGYFRKEKPEKTPDDVETDIPTKPGIPSAKDRLGPRDAQDVVIPTDTDWDGLPESVEVEIHGHISAPLMVAPNDFKKQNEKPTTPPAPPPLVQPPTPASPTPVTITTDLPGKVGKPPAEGEDNGDGTTTPPGPMRFKGMNAGRGRPVESPVSKPQPAEDVGDGKPAPQARAVGVNPVINAAVQPFSTFSIDVDTAAYTLSRNCLVRGQLPPPEAVRTEEFVNYFDYDYAPPIAQTFAVYTDCGPAPFGRGLSLLKIGVKGRLLGREEKKAAMLTLLIDTSGSMATPDRIELVKSALVQMVDKLAPNDKVAIVQYDSRARLVLEPTRAADKKKIQGIIEGLQTSGSTSLEEGMRAAYLVAAREFNSAACNRVLLFSDGMANLGSAVAEDILKAVAEFRKQGITLSVFGVGQGAYNDAMLEGLANKGDGVYAFLDSPAEAKRVLVDDLAATVNLIARDVKIQVEFNPKRVHQYRQLGYENRLLKKEDFRNDSVDAGEIGSGQSVTALYELALDGDPRDPLGVVRVRCRNALTGRIEETEHTIQPPAGTLSIEAMNVRFRLAAAAAEFAEILRGSPYAAGSRFEDVAKLLRPVALELSLDGRIQEFLRLTQTGLVPKYRDVAAAE
jgi:Ca-activated chloride channel family protein